ncbi:NF-kappa-B inhibitor delta isoform X3 [Mirounga angustirostris]|uniref:NF-kappa-B inhibitor delta isoform X3 n=1 Tax=Mirounga angustirostris TaxID=9716 RepID=UPI00313AC24F
MSAPPIQTGLVQARPGDSRACGRGPALDWAGPEPQFKNSRGTDPRSGTRRRLRGGRARLAQRRGRGPGGPQSAPRNPRVSRSERSHCPSQTVKKLLEEQRRRQQQPDAGGVPGQFPPPLAQSLTPSVNESEAGLPGYPALCRTFPATGRILERFRTPPRTPTVTPYGHWTIPGHSPCSHAGFGATTAAGPGRGGRHTPLLVAAAANQPLIVEDLLNLGAEPNATDHQGRSVLHVAATYGLPGVLSAVINSGVQVDLEARDFEGLTPLHTAILALNVAMHPPDLCPRVLSTQARDRLACVQMLLHMGADHTSQEIKSNKTVLHLAVQAANPTLVQLLLELPQGDLRAFVNMKAHGNTALHMAAALPPGPPQEAIVRRLLAAGADPTLRNLENEQPVHLLRPGPGPEGLRQLLKRSRVAPPGLSS